MTDLLFHKGLEQIIGIFYIDFMCNFLWGLKIIEQLIPIKID